MYIDSQKAQEQAVLNLAYSICAAARTAPKARGADHMDTAILTGEDKQRLADEMRRLCEQVSMPFFVRDAGNVEKSDAIVLVGIRRSTRAMEKACMLCGFSGCDDCSANGALCIFTGIDLGIALGSAVALASDNRVDNRIMYSIGKAAVTLGLLSECDIIVGIPLSVSGKSPYFDRA